MCVSASLDPRLTCVPVSYRFWRAEAGRHDLPGAGPRLGAVAVPAAAGGQPVRLPGHVRADPHDAHPALVLAPHLALPQRLLLHAAAHHGQADPPLHRACGRRDLLGTLQVGALNRWFPTQIHVLVHLYFSFWMET